MQENGEKQGDPHLSFTAAITISKARREIGGGREEIGRFQPRLPAFERHHAANPTVEVRGGGVGAHGLMNQESRDQYFRQ